MKNSTILIRLLTLQLVLVISGCVGTVQNSDVPLNSLSDESKDTIPFSGLDRGQAISDKKIELIFTPVASADPNLKYLLYINGSQSPIEISPDSLDDTVGGAKRYLLDNLNINTEYKFQLKLKNTLTNAQSIKEKVLVIRTFDNRTADFKGITSVKKVTGLSASSIQVDWVSARMDGVIVAKEYDPVYYEISIIGDGGPQNLNNATYTGVDRRVIKFPDPLLAQISPMNQSDYTSTIIDSLQPSTTYYVQVRAVNKLYYLFSIDPSLNVIPVNREVNTKYLKIKTDPATGTFDFNRNSLRMANALGSEAFTKVNAFWSPGIGTFTGYKLFLRKFATSSANESTVLATDLLDTVTMDGISNGIIPPSDTNGRFLKVTTDKTSFPVPNLSTYDWYQFKIVQCKTTLCPTDPADPNAGIISELRAIRVQPALAPFDGISGIENPKSSIQKDEVKVKFDPPSISTGYADKLEVYCLEPSSVTAGNPAGYQFEPTPLGLTPKTGATTVPRCNGLYLTAEPALTANNLVVKGIKTIPNNSAADATYCFAVFPAIRYQPEQIPLPGTFPKADWVVRCVTPEIKTPSISQFSGLSGSCSPINNTIRVTWSSPTGGIYTNYRLYYKPIVGNDNFKFSDAISGSVGYQSLQLADGLTNYTIPNLRPGTRYRLGMLTEIDVASTTNGVTTTKTLYSEYNTNIKDCVTPLPVATFDEWTRIFAIGPKVDGRFPNAVFNSKRLVPEEAKVLEALTVDGIPFELKIPNSGDPLAAPYVLAPGHYDPSYIPASYTDFFDGAFGTYKKDTFASPVTVAASQNGIVSLGWRDVSLSFLGNEFIDCQKHNLDGGTPVYAPCGTIPTLRSNRRYGYKVYRSDDNRLSWKDITGASGTQGTSLVYARPFTYKVRPTDTLAARTDRMAFFTDYSVNAIYSDPEGRERGRILWYKIVPYFDKMPLSFANMNSNVIKVVLPPPNMALVKREMANRSACMDIGRYESTDGTIKKDEGEHYTCVYTGVGSRPKGVPWGTRNTVVDLGGDLIIDRFELGCQYTRGDYISKADDGASFFTRDPNDQLIAPISDLRTFNGNSTSDDGTDKGKFVGCTSGSSPAGLESNGDPTLTSPGLSYKKTIYGDCIGQGTLRLPEASCGSSGDPTKAIILGLRFPGAYPVLNPDCSRDDLKLTNPQTFADRVNQEFRRHLLIQSEYAAVFYMRNTGDGLISVLGPGHTKVVDDYLQPSEGNSQCQINLAAIGSDGNVRARWFPVESLDKVKSVTTGIQSIAGKSLSQVLTDPALYDNTEYKKPADANYINNRFDLGTKVSRIATANSAKIPPLSGVSQKFAQELCSTYEVEIGIFDGTNFLPTTLPMAKRLLRRHELLASSRWPQHYNESKISTLEGSSAAGACQNASKSSSLYSLGRDTYISNQSATPAPFGMSANGKTLTGSSDTDSLGTGADSSKCVSAYGVQDLIGNVAEISTERLYCDYSKDKLFFGQYAGNPVANTGSGDENLSVKIEDYQGTTISFWKNTQIMYEQANGSYVSVGTGNSPNSNVAWAQINPKSGYCSIVDNNEAFAIPSAGNQARYRTGDSFNPIFTSGGAALNTNIIKRPNYGLPWFDQPTVDQESVNYLRNGDGYFLNFGYRNLAPQFKVSNSLSITASGITPNDENALGPFFNPIIGMPLSCTGGTCDDTLDNKLVTTPFFWSQRAQDVDTHINDFPIGNSQIYNTGISDFNFGGGIAYTTSDLNQDQTNNGALVVDQIIVPFGGSPQLRTKTMAQWWIDNPAYHSLQQFSIVKFVLPRETQLIFSNGGSTYDGKTGRYTASTVLGGEEQTKGTAGLGFRCGVLINSD